MLCPFDEFSIFSLTEVMWGHLTTGRHLSPEVETLRFTST